MQTKRDSQGPRRKAPDPGELRRLAARRRAVGDRVRRLLPGIIVGSTTLVGTGALAAWVSSQPGVDTTAGRAAVRPAAAPASTSPATDALRSLQQALQADETALRSLEAGMPTIPSAGPSTAGGAPVTAPAVAPLPQIAIPALPQVVSSPAPAVNATTGASHAIP